jgi:limonene-1,2-epoxide hydrolase
LTQINIRLRKALLPLLLIAIAIPARAAAPIPAPEAGDISIAMNFLGSVGRLDFDAATALLDKDAVLDLPYVNEGLIVRGQDNIVQFFRRTMAKSIAGIAYKLEQAYPSPTAGATVLEISTQGRTATGQNFTNRLVGIFVIRNGKIVLFREYFNAAKIG